MSRAVLFDFSGTLFDDTSVLTGARLAARCARRDVRLTMATANAFLAAMQSTVDSPAGRSALRGADGDSGTHRARWTALAESVPGAGPAIAAAYYDCVTDVRAWLPYPDTAATLGALRRAGVPVAVVSNTGWDISGSFSEAGLAGLVDAFVLSCDLGLEKPDPRLFETACQKLGVQPADALMVGDDPVRDGGAAAAGVPVYLLPRDRAGDRPRGLSAVLRLVGVEGVA
ncbi:HAD family hydrolase [Amycolatopsis coloradensis]|uniref:HAD family hydrolase n=1 Tax=Amycolatopsis coloradensis TaxID=76021 RepID=A0ACD5BAJ5_9PSEU